MNISVFGLGYVGTVIIGCLSKIGHRVIGVDISENKVNTLNSGKSPIVESDIDDIIQKQFQAKKISATMDSLEAVINSDVSFICVGTPSTKNGHLELEGVFRAASEIGRGITEKKTFHTVVVRSTVFPGTNEKITKIIAESSGKKINEDFAVVSNPEFLREGTAVKDFISPPYTLLGSESPRAIKVMHDVYSNIDAEIIETSIEVAEMIKYVNNTFHALKIVFANEVGNICKKLNIDSHKLMEVFCKDTKLNISSSYLKPGFAFGGSCLPKDHRALRTLAHDAYLSCPIIEGIEASNTIQKETVLNQIIDYGKSKIGFLGLSFKEGTDDLRNSPIIDVLEKLLGKGFDVRIYDSNVHLSRLIGKNREFIFQRIPYISKFLVEKEEDIIEFAEVIVIVNKEAEFPTILKKIKHDTIIYDLVGIEDEAKLDGVKYEGISW